MDVTFEKPVLNRKTPEENIALIDKWISESTDKLKYLFHEINKQERRDNASD